MKKIIYISSFLILLLTSCSDFLEPKSQTEFMPREINSLNEMLLGSAYLDPVAQNQYVFSYHELFTDDMACTVVNGNHITNAEKYSRLKYYFAWDPRMFEIAKLGNTYYAVWGNTYGRILGCNAALDYVDKPDLKGKEAEKDYVKAQALALRAFYYFNLVNLFGEPYNYNKEALGVPLKLSSDMLNVALYRSTVSEVYQQMIEDLESAEQHFLNLPVDLQKAKNGRVTLAMVQLMRARVALFMEDYATCEVYSKKVINDWGLQLLNLNSFTSIAAQPFYDFTTYDNPEAIWLFGCSYDFIKFTTDLIYPQPGSQTNGRRIVNASPSLLNSYGASDLRKSNYIIRESTTINNYMPFGKLPVSTTYALLTTKFGRALRLSEAYLMLAESNYFQNKPTEAVQVLEKLRINRMNSSSGDDYKVPAASTTGVALLQFIKEERRREMCFEGLRWFDQRRWGMESFSREWKEEGVVVNTFTLEKNDAGFTLPIPPDAIENNPNLIQNKLTNQKF